MKRIDKKGRVKVVWYQYQHKREALINVKMSPDSTGIWRFVLKCITWFCLSWRSIWQRGKLWKVEDTLWSAPPHLLPNPRLSISHSAPLFFFLLLTTPCRALKRDLLVAWWLKPGFQGTKLPVFPHPLLLFSLSMNSFFPKCRVLNDRRMCIVKQWKTHAFSRQQPSSFKINRAVTDKPHASPEKQNKRTQWVTHKCKLIMFGAINEQRRKPFSFKHRKHTYFSRWKKLNQLTLWQGIGKGGYLVSCTTECLHMMRSDKCLGFISLCSKQL
jgi:hypothetical protein